MEPLVYNSSRSPQQFKDEDTTHDDSPESKRPHLDPQHNLMDLGSAVPDTKGYSVKNFAHDSDPRTYLSRESSSLTDYEWLRFPKLFLDDSVFETACKYVDEHLASNDMFLLDTKSRSPADFQLCKYLCRTGEKWKKVLQLKKYLYLSYFYQLVNMEYNRKVILDIRTPGFLHNGRDGKVCLRFSIEPFPRLDFQSARLALLLEYYTKMYKGRLIIHIDDNYPNMESIKYEASLLEDLRTLGVRCDTVKHTSDYFSQLLKKAESLICEGKAYVDYTPQEDIQKEVTDGIESKCRAHSMEKNMDLWKEMIAGSDVGSKCCLRGKLDMQSPTQYLRDPVYYYCNSVVAHHRTGKEFKLYPTLDFSDPYIDAIEHISHPIRLDCHPDTFQLYYRLLMDMGFPRINIVPFKMLKMVYTPSTTRQLSWFVDNKIVDGWDDPRLPTVQALLRRGLTIDAMQQFVYEQGVSKTNVIEWDRLWSINYDKLRTAYPVQTVIQDRVLLRLKFPPGMTDEDEQKTVTICGHPKVVRYSKDIWLDNADGSTFFVGAKIDLFKWSTVVIENVETDEEGRVFLTGSLDSGCSLKSLKPKLWLPARDDLVRLSLVKFGYLLKEKQVLEERSIDIQDCQSSTREELIAWGESDMRNLKNGDIRLLTYKGFYRCDVPSDRPSDPVVLFHISHGTSIGVQGIRPM